MKTIVSFLVCVIASQTSYAQDFKTEFRKVFSASIKGFESNKGIAVGGGWSTEEKLAGYTDVMIKTDEDLGVLYVQFSIICANADDAKVLLASKELEVVDALPAGQYNQTKTYDEDYLTSMKTIFEFNTPKMADLQKRPSIEMGAVDVYGTVMVVLNLYEPYFKNQYTPGF